MVKMKEKKERMEKMERMERMENVRRKLFLSKIYQTMRH